MNTQQSLGAVDLFQQLAQNNFGFFQRIESIATIMTSDVETLTLDDTLQDAMDLFQRTGFRHAPVLEDGDVVGIVSDRDILRHRPPMLGTAAEGDSDHQALLTPVSQFMTRGPAAVSSDAAPAEVLTMMLERHIDCLLVHDALNQLAGIVTPRDFIKMVLLFHRVCTGNTDLERFRLVDLDMSRGLPLDLIFSRGARSVRDVMTKKVVFVMKEDSIESAARLMQSVECRHLPVVNDMGKVVGMLTDRDILGALPLPVPLPKPREVEKGFRQRLFATQDQKMPVGTVASLMTKNPAKINPESLMIDAISTMLEDGTSGFPVVNSNDNMLCGIFTSNDVLRLFRVIMQIGASVTKSA